MLGGKCFINQVKKGSEMYRCDLDITKYQIHQIHKYFVIRRGRGGHTDREPSA